MGLPVQTRWAKGKVGLVGHIKELRLFLKSNEKLLKDFKQRSDIVKWRQSFRYPPTALHFISPFLLQFCSAGACVLLTQDFLVAMEGG